MLTDAEKHEAIEAIALAITLNEPEQMIERLRHICKRKARENLTNEADRWRDAETALDEALDTLAELQQSPPKEKIPEPEITAEADDTKAKAE